MTGAFGTGKTTLAPLVAERLTECFVMDADWLLEPLSVLAGQDLHSFEPLWPALGDIWLAIAEVAARGNRSTVLFSPGEPSELERLSSRELVGEAYSLLLDCDDDLIRSRLDAREDWSEESTRESLVDAARMRALGLPTLCTDVDTPPETASKIVAWVRQRLAA